MKLLKAALAILAVALAALFALFGRKQTQQKTSAVVEQQAQNAKTQMEETLEKTPAPDLVAGAPDAPELRHLTDGLKADAQSRIRDRLAGLGKTELAGNPSHAEPGSGPGGRGDH